MKKCKERTAKLAELKDKIEELNRNQDYCYGVGMGDLALDHAIWRNNVHHLEDLSLDVLTEEFDIMVVENE